MPENGRWDLILAFKGLSLVVRKETARF